MKNHILNIEGIPGSGKSTTAAQLDGLFCIAGINSYWVQEEAKDHPIGTTQLPRTEDAERLANSYLDVWRTFVNDNTQVVILDGYALQSSVRFLFAMNASKNTLHQYFQTWQRIGKHNTSIVFLKVEDPEKHFYQFLFPLRGDDWSQKMSSYVVSTPYGQERGLSGKDGIIKFWSKYQACCLELMCDPVISTQIQNYTDRNWIETHLEYMQHLTKNQ